MGKEIERKFRVANESWRTGTEGVRYAQGYLAVGPPVAIRVRVGGGKAMLNVKKATLDIVRDEFEYPIPLEDAEAMLAHLCEGGIVEKTRYRVPFAGHVWEVDVFEGANAGLLVAEVELRDRDEAVELPPWAGDEVSGDARFLNTSLSRHPYTQWGQNQV